MIGNLFIEIADKAEIKGNTVTSDFVEEKPVIINNYQNQIQRGRKIELKYTIKQGDYKRLDSEGFLEVYNLNQLIKIPVRRLLGKWEKTHIGITVIKTNGRWKIDGGQLNIIINNTKRSVVFAILKKRIVSFLNY